MFFQQIYLKIYSRTHDDMNYSYLVFKGTASKITRVFTKLPISFQLFFVESIVAPLHYFKSQMHRYSFQIRHQSYENHLEVFHHRLAL